MEKKRIKIIEPLKQETDVDNINIISFLNKYKIGYIIFPDALQRNLKLSEERTRKILDRCESFGICNRKYVASCPNCRQLDSKLYSQMPNSPYYINCVHCDTEQEATKDDFEVIYELT